MKKAFFLGLAIATGVIITSLFVPVSTLAKGQETAKQACPVSIQNNLHFTNQGSQPISTIIFHSVRIDAVGGEVGPSPDEAKLLAAFHADSDSQSEQSYRAKKGFNPGEQAHMGNNMGVYGRPDKGTGIAIYVRAVKFMDGSVWKDDGSHSCKWGFTNAR